MHFFRSSLISFHKEHSRSKLSGKQEVFDKKSDMCGGGLIKKSLATHLSFSNVHFSHNSIFFSFTLRDFDNVTVSNNENTLY